MQFKETLVRLSFFLFPLSVFSQTTYIPAGSIENRLLERLEIKAQTDSLLNFSTAKPYSSKRFIPVIEKYYNAAGGYGSGQVTSDSANAVSDVGLSPVDLFNARLSLMDYPEWSQQQFQSKKPIWKHFYQNPVHLYEVNSKDFFLVIDPAIQYVQGKESNNSENIFLNTRGISLRGYLAKKIAFYSYLSDNQERDPLYVQDYVQSHFAVPGEGFFQQFKQTGYDYFDARGYINFNAAKYIDITFGYDRNFIGDGYRSLFLSDFSGPYLFLKLDTRIWKLHYQNLFTELVTANRLPHDKYLPKKYAAMHHLDLGLTKWLNLGVFEGIIFGRTNHFEFGYLNPVIFYRSAEQQNGSSDNSVAGLDAKANVAKKFQFYMQFLLDEFSFTEIKKHRGWWGNKYGWQLGAKYVDAFDIRNLDLQLEINSVRPFTYSHNDSVSNYSHGNLPLAHPLGANFRELIGIARYQPAPKWLLEAKAIYYLQGKDTANISFGSNILLPDLPSYRLGDYGYSIGSGIRDKTLYSSLLLSYQLKPNLFLEANGVYRRENADYPLPSTHTFVLYFGVRWNLARRNFEF
jgi:hypothetical protein